MHTCTCMKLPMQLLCSNATCRSVIHFQWVACVLFPVLFPLILVSSFFLSFLSPPFSYHSCLLLFLISLSFLPCIAATFVSLLLEVESTYEVHDYIRSFLGETDEVHAFAKQFLEKRQKLKSPQQQKTQVC